ncbi:MAG: DUF1786 family protein [Dehalococcoidia bacterium]
MRILALDIGTGTQDILLFDSARAVENCVQMVMPAPTAIAADRVRAATMKRLPVIITGTNMGGGPVTDAVVAHIATGIPAFATPAAAVTFNDDLEMVRDMGVTLISEEEAAHLDGVQVSLMDLDLGMVRRALEAFQVIPTWDALAVAVFDHGNAPPGYSDRKFRFDHLREQVLGGKREIFSFSYLAAEVPDYLTRMRAVVETAGDEVPLLLLDTAEAGVVGSMEDPRVAAQSCKVVANIGNEHTLAFHLHGATIQGLFEHHTHVLSRERLEEHIVSLVRGDLDGDEVWRGQGHGAIVLEGGEELNFLSVTGPMRGILMGSRLEPYFATPHGAMMLAGCFGLVRAWAERQPLWREEIMKALRTVGEGLGHQH